MNKKATQEDVARLAGVSRATVSYVINDLPGGSVRISEETRQRVLDAVNQLGYQPNALARSLATRRTHTLALIVQDISNPFFSGIARGVEGVARAEGYSVLLCSTEEDPAHELEVLQVLDEKRVDGVISCSSRLPESELRQALVKHPAAVLVNRLLSDQEDAAVINSVVIDEEAGGQMATQHLISRGHRVIGFLSGPPLSFGAQGRSRGYSKALAANGIPARQDIVFACQPTVECGQEATRTLLTDHPEITALFCYNDLVAVGAFQACVQLGRRIPDDLAVVGYDDIRLAALVTPPLTTCRVRREQFGQLAIRLLLDRINNPAEDCQQMVVQPELVIRASAP
jgi:LacI family transcriptional regulator